MVKGGPTRFACEADQCCIAKMGGYLECDGSNKGKGWGFLSHTFSGKGRGKGHVSEGGKGPRAFTLFEPNVITSAFLKLLLVVYLFTTNIHPLANRSLPTQQQ